MWWRYLNEDNPFYIHLTRHWQDRYVLTIPIPYLSVGIALGMATLLLCTVWMTAINFFFNNSSPFMFILALGSVFLLILLLPIAFSISVALSTARHARNADFDLTLLTNLTESQMVWSYWGVHIHRFRWGSLRLIPLVPYTILALGFLISFVLLLTAPEWIFLVVVVAGSYVVWYWLCQMLGLTIGLALRHRILVWETATGIGLLLTGIWVWGLLQVVLIVGGWLSSPYSPSAWQIGLLIAWLITPAFLGWRTLHLANYFVRNPL